MTYKISRDLSETIFRTYDIRGVVGETMTPDSVYSIGRAIGSQALKTNQKKVAIGRDGRLSGPELLKALAQGLLDSGCDVLNLGEVTTPMLYFAANVLDTRSGVMLTGSHNPPNFNGIKIVIDGVTLCEGAITALRQRVLDDDLTEGAGIEEHINIEDRYVEAVTSSVKLSRPLKVIIDCGNGVGGKIAPRVFRALGCDVTELFCEVDGNFPNHHPDPLIADNLKDIIRVVKEQKADLGLAFDGDADRLGIVTETGEIIWPDRQMILFIRDILPRNPGAHIPFDVKCTRHLASEITKHGGIPDMIRTGHALLKAKVWELNAPIGGELSGHFFFKERWYGFDDGVYSGARLLEILSQSQETAGTIFQGVPNSINTPELKMHMDDEIKYEFMDRFLAQAKSQFPDGKVNTIDGIRVDFADGFGLVRPSNTTPTIIFRFEGDTIDALENIKAKFKEQLLALDTTLQLPF